MTFPNRPLRRSEASVYLKDKHGIDRAPATLAKLASIGGGPRYHKANRIPIYPPDFLDEWAVSILSPPLNSTSDPGTEANNSPNAEELERCAAAVGTAGVSSDGPEAVQKLAGCEA